LFLGYLIAVVVSLIVKRSLDKLKLNDRLARVFEPEAPPSAGKAAYDVTLWTSRAIRYLIMLFVLVAFFDVMRITVVTEPLNELLTQVIGYIPRIVGPLLLLGAAWIVATLVRSIALKVLTTLHFDQRLGEKAGLSGSNDGAVSTV